MGKMKILNVYSFLMSKTVLESWQLSALWRSCTVAAGTSRGLGWCLQVDDGPSLDGLPSNVTVGDGDGQKVGKKKCNQ